MGLNSYAAYPRDRLCKSSVLGFKKSTRVVEDYFRFKTSKLSFCARSKQIVSDLLSLGSGNIGSSKVSLQNTATLDSICIRLESLCARKVAYKRKR